jgi:hypothetical protein
LGWSGASRAIFALAVAGGWCFLLLSRERAAPLFANQGKRDLDQADAVRGWRSAHCEFQGCGGQPLRFYRIAAIPDANPRSTPRALIMATPRLDMEVVIEMEIQQHVEPHSNFAISCHHVTNSTGVFQQFRIRSSKAGGGPTVVEHGHHATCFNAVPSTRHGA